jgi:hypothetical protein
LVLCIAKIFECVPKKHIPWLAKQKKMDLNHFPAISIIMESDSWNNFQFHGTKLDFFLTGIKKICALFF